MEVSSIKGVRTHNSVTFNPTIKRPGEKIYVRIPKLNPTVCIIPNTMFLEFKFKNSNTKSRFLNNLSRLLVEQLQIQFDSTVVYDNIGESTIQLYKDMWLSAQTRNRMKRFGIASENVRKLMSGDDSGSDSDTTHGVNDKLIAGRCDNFYLRLGQILNDHGLLAPYGINYDIIYTLTLPKASDIMEAQTSESVGTYEIESLRLVYQTITNEDLARSVLNSYSGKSLTFEDCSLQTVQTWPKGDTDINVNLQITKKWLKYVVLLFKYTDQVQDEVFVYPNIDEVRVQANNLPNSLFSKGIKSEDMYDEALAVFGRENEDVLYEKFYTERFALVLDFRTLPDNNKFKLGNPVFGGDGIQIAVKKRVTTKDVKCMVYVMSDKFINVTRDALLESHS